MDELQISYWLKDASTFHFTSLQLAVVQELNQTDDTVMSALGKTTLRLQIEKNLAGLFCQTCDDWLVSECIVLFVVSHTARLDSRSQTMYRLNSRDLVRW